MTDPRYELFLGEAEKSHDEWKRIDDAYWDIRCWFYLFLWATKGEMTC